MEAGAKPGGEGRGYGGGGSGSARRGMRGLVPEGRGAGSVLVRDLFIIVGDR